MRIDEPAAYWHRIIRMEDIARWRVVEDDRVLYRPTELREVLDVGGAPVVVAALAEEPVLDDVVDVKFVQNRICILGEGTLASAILLEGHSGTHTLAREAVNTTTS
jgi:hypothetical protein